MERFKPWDSLIEGATRHDDRLLGFAYAATHGRVQGPPSSHHPLTRYNKVSMASYAINVYKPQPWISMKSTIAPVDQPSTHFWEFFRGDLEDYCDKFRPTPHAHMTLACPMHGTKYYCSLFLEKDGTNADDCAPDPNRPDRIVQTDETKRVGMFGFMSVYVKRGGNIQESWSSRGGW